MTPADFKEQVDCQFLKPNDSLTTTKHNIVKVEDNGQLKSSVTIKNDLGIESAIKARNSCKAGGIALEDRLDMKDTVVC